MMNTSPVKKSTIVSEVAQRRADEAMLARMCDALVRACRTDASSSSALAQRLLEHWREHPHIELVIEPMRMRIGDRVVLESSREEGRWLLPAFMAGVRVISIEQGVMLDDAMRLAKELSALKLDEDSLGAFRNWLWSDGAEGWRVECHMSFVEILELDTSSDQYKDALIGSLRASAMLSMDERAVSISARDLDVAALQPEFSMSIDALNAGVRSRAFELTEAEQQNLRRSSSLLDDWADAELSMVLGNEAMQRALPVRRIAQRLLSAMQARGSVSLMERVCAIYADDTDPFSVKLVQELGRQDVVQILSRLNLGTPKMRQLMVIWLMSLSDQECHQWWSSLLGHAQVDTIAAMIGDYSVELLLEHLDLTTLDSRQGIALISALQMSDIPREAWLEILSQCKARVIAHAIDEFSDRDMIDAVPLLSQISSHMEEAEVQQAMERVLDRRLGGLTVQIAAMVEPCWPLHLVRRVFRELREQGGLEEIVKHMRHRKHSMGLRTIALDEVERFPLKPRRAALKWRLAEMFDPPEFSDKLRQAREKARRAHPEETGS